MSIYKTFFIFILVSSFVLKPMELSKQIEISNKDFFLYGDKYLPKKYKPDVDLGNITWDDTTKKYVFRQKARLAFKQTDYRSNTTIIIESVLAKEYPDACWQGPWYYTLYSTKHIEKTLSVERCEEINKQINADAIEQLPTKVTISDNKPEQPDDSINKIVQLFSEVTISNNKPKQPDDSINKIVQLFSEVTISDNKPKQPDDSINKIVQLFSEVYISDNNSQIYKNYNLKVLHNYLDIKKRLKFSQYYTADIGYLCTKNYKPSDYKKCGIAKLPKELALDYQSRNICFDKQRGGYTVCKSIKCLLENENKEKTGTWLMNRQVVEQMYNSQKNHGFKPYCDTYIAIDPKHQDYLNIIINSVAIFPILNFERKKKKCAMPDQIINEDELTPEQKLLLDKYYLKHNEKAYLPFIYYRDLWLLNNIWYDLVEKKYKLAGVLSQNKSTLSLILGTYLQNPPFNIEVQSNVLPKNEIESQIAREIVTILPPVQK